jgi:hypothetical protein
MNLEINKLIKDIDNTLGLTLSKVGLSNSNLSKNTKIIISQDVLRVIMPDYAIYVDKGRRGGKRPPIKAILNWMKQAGINTKGVRQIDIAYAISNSIGQKGIKPRPFIDTFQKSITNLIMKQLERQIDNILNNKR